MYIVSASRYQGTKVGTFTFPKKLANLAPSCSNAPNALTRSATKAQLLCGSTFPPDIQPQQQHSPRYASYLLENALIGTLRAHPQPYRALLLHLHTLRATTTPFKSSISDLHPPSLTWGVHQPPTRRRRCLRS